MSGGPRHDEYQVRHAATFRRRLARAEAEAGDLRRRIRTTEAGDERVALHVELAGVLKRIQRLRSAARE